MLGYLVGESETIVETETEIVIASRVGGVRVGGCGWHWL